jgi:hypothetical protein
VDVANGDARDCNPWRGAGTVAQGQLLELQKRGGGNVTRCCAAAATAGYVVLM